MPEETPEIIVEQHCGRTRSGRTVGHNFDDIWWIDGPHRRYVAICGHGPDHPIQWREAVPESIADLIRERVQERKAEREAAERDTAAAAVTE